MSIRSTKRLCTFLLSAVCVIALAACGEAVSTSSFKGEKGVIAQRISQFQSDAAKDENETICHSDLAASIRAHLKIGGSDCEQAIKTQLAQVDGFALSITSIDISGEKATALVRSTYSGKTKSSKLELVREDRTWKISGLSSS